MYIFVLYVFVHILPFVKAIYEQFLPSPLAPIQKEFLLLGAQLSFKGFFLIDIFAARKIYVVYAWVG